MAQDLQFASSPSTESGGVRLWLSYHDYAKRLLLGEGANPWTTAVGFLQFFSQAQGLLKPEVAILDVKDLYKSWLDSDSQARTELAGKRRPMAALKTLLEAEAPRDLLREIITAVAFQLKGGTPLVLAIPSPRHWLWWAANEASGADIEVDADNAENAAVYLADYIRAFSELSIAGVLLVERPEQALEAETPLEAYRPIYNVAKHYRWPVGVRLPSTYASISVSPEDVRYVIGATPLSGSAPVLALDVSKPLWAGETIPDAGPGHIRFVEIPPGENPEKVLEFLGKIRG